MIFLKEIEATVIDTPNKGKQTHFCAQTFQFKNSVQQFCPAFKTPANAKSWKASRQK